MSQYDAQETAGKAEEDELPTVQKVAILMVALGQDATGR